jgi:hypothetical protein
MFPKRKNKIMGYTMIEISESKVEKMSEYVEDMLWAGGELMHCLEKIKEESEMGERGGSYGMRGGRYGNRNDEMRMRGGRGSMGYRDDEDDDEWEMMERRRRDSRGRYR